MTTNLMQRYNPLYGQISQLIKSQLLGNVLHGYFENYACDEGLGSEHWFWDPKKSGGIFIEHGVHFLDIVWAFPIYLLAISLSVILVTSGLDLGVIHIGAGSLLLPILIIASVYVPYVARPVRGMPSSPKGRDFIQAAIASGASDWHILRKEILPNVAPSVIVFFPLMVALNILTESALSILGIGVQPPQASWGTIINSA